MAMSRRAAIQYADLTTFSVEVLLKTFASLTHRMHAGRHGVASLTLMSSLRERRDLVEKEILHRMAKK